MSVLAYKRQVAPRSIEVMNFSQQLSQLRISTESETVTPEGYMRVSATARDDDTLSSNNTSTSQFVVAQPQKHVGEGSTSSCTTKQQEGEVSPPVEPREELEVKKSRTRALSVPRTLEEVTRINEAVKKTFFRLPEEAKLAANLGESLTTICDEYHATYGDASMQQITRQRNQEFASTSIFKNLPKFVGQLMRECKFEPSTLVHIWVYIKRLHKTGKFMLNWFNVHRVVLTCALVSDKVLDDDHGTTQYYAHNSGTDDEHMAIMEVRLLQYLKWDVSVLHDEFEAARTALLNFR